MGRRNKDDANNETGKTGKSASKKHPLPDPKRRYTAAEGRELFQADIDYTKARRARQKEHRIAEGFDR